MLLYLQAWRIIEYILPRYCIIYNYALADAFIQSNLCEHDCEFS